MIKKIALALLLVVLLAVAWFYAIGSGWLGGGPWESAAVAEGPRPLPGTVSRDPQILFGDLHTHTNYSLDAYVFNTGLVKGGGVVTPADACDFARYCAALDFWSINDHAEGLTPRVWADSVNAIRDCNARSGPAQNPDMVSFVGWEWSNSNADDVPSHYGHKNVIFKTWEEGRTPTRPISSQDNYIIAKIPAPLLGLLSLRDEIKAIADFGWYVSESINTPVCAEGIASTDLPADCREVAKTPTQLYRKLDEWGFESLVIPHGLAWGTTNPLTADFKNQLDEYEARYQKLLETFSGHGNSERFVDFERTVVDAAGTASCPESTPHFTPCCQRAGELVQASCAEPTSEPCIAAVARMKQDYAQKGARAGRKLLPDASLNDWAGCGQLQNTFQPASMYVPRQSTQYNLALGFDTNGNPKRTRFGLIGSSDNHMARPGNSYKEMNRPIFTDSKFVTGNARGLSYSADKESGGFYYTGGLVAVHSQGRHRDAIWDGLNTRQVYATSGDRMLVWFDLLNAPGGIKPMGSEITMSENPRFRVRALGAFEQKPGCPDYARAALGKDRLQTLCGGECYQSGDRRKAISRVEIVRIRPQVRPDEPIAPLIEHQWKVFECESASEGCDIEFEDADYAGSERSALYYARVIQQAEPLIAGDPFGCEFDDDGNCVQRKYCIGDDATSDNDCTSMAEPRAWTSPIFLEHGGQP